jgi:hypothetical protein
LGSQFGFFLSLSSLPGVNESNMYGPVVIGLFW